jgi:hypothetical protein
MFSRLLGFDPRRSGMLAVAALATFGTALMAEAQMSGPAPAAPAAAPPATAAPPAPQTKAGPPLPKPAETSAQTSVKAAPARLTPVRKGADPAAMAADKADAASAAAPAAKATAPANIKTGAVAQTAAGAAPAAKPAAGAAAPTGRCTRLAFEVNDYGKEGPTKDAKELLDKHIANWAQQKGIKRYTVGKKVVNCRLFLDFIVFDEHTCRAEAPVCW